MRNLLLVAAPLGLLFSSVASAQLLQLPEIHQFATGSSTLIPDRGAADGGGIMRRTESVTPSRVPYSPSHRTVTIKAFPYFYKKQSGAHTEEVRSLAASGLISGSPFRTKPYGHELGEEPETDVDSLRMIGAADLHQTAPDSLAKIRQQLSAEDSIANREAIHYADLAEDCVKQGKTSIAKLFYRSAIDTARGKYQEQLQRRLEELDKSPNTGRQESLLPR